MKTMIFLPILFILSYLVFSFVSLGPYGGAGHGLGIGAFMMVSLPSILLAIAFDAALPKHDLTVWLGLIFGSLQYGLLGFVLACLITWMRRRNRQLH